MDPAERTDRWLDPGGLVAGVAFGVLAAIALRVVHTLLAPALLVLVAALLLAMPAPRRPFALGVAVACAGATRAALLLVDPVDPENGWLQVLAAESLAVALVALRWPLWGAATLLASTALHRWRVVEYSWRADELPLAIAYAFAAVALVALAAQRSRPSAR